MSTLFLIPCILTLGAACILKVYEKTEDELSVYVALVGLPSLVLALVLSPWEIKLLLIAALLFQKGWVFNLQPSTFSDRSQPEQHLPNPQPTEPPVFQTTFQPEAVGKYRGAPFKFNPSPATMPQTAKILKYRGATVR